MVPSVAAEDAILNDPVLAKLREADAGSVERWIVVTVVDAFIHCAKHIPRMQPMDHEVVWGTDDAGAKRGDFFGAACTVK